MVADQSSTEDSPSSLTEIKEDLLVDLSARGYELLKDKLELCLYHVKTLNELVECVQEEMNFLQYELRMGDLLIPQDLEERIDERFMLLKVKKKNKPFLFRFSNRSVKLVTKNQNTDEKLLAICEEAKDIKSIQNQILNNQEVDSDDGYQVIKSYSCEETKQLPSIDPIKLYKEKTFKNGGNQYKMSKDFTDFVYELFISKESHKFVISQSSKCSRLPEISVLNLSNISTVFSPDLNCFLESVAPFEMKVFKFGGLKQQNLLDTKEYLRSLVKVCECVAQKVEFYNCLFSDSDLQLIIKASSRAESLTFQSCKFSVSNIEISESPANQISINHVESLPINDHLEEPTKL